MPWDNRIYHFDNVVSIFPSTYFVHSAKTQISASYAFCLLPLFLKLQFWANICFLCTALYTRLTDGMSKGRTEHSQVLCRCCCLKLLTIRSLLSHLNCCSAPLKRILLRHRLSTPWGMFNVTHWVNKKFLTVFQLAWVWIRMQGCFHCLELFLVMDYLQVSDAFSGSLFEIFYHHFNKCQEKKKALLYNIILWGLCYIIAEGGFFFSVVRNIIYKPPYTEALLALDISLKKND